MSRTQLDQQMPAKEINLMLNLIKDEYKDRSSILSLNGSNMEIVNMKNNYEYKIF